MTCLVYFRKHITYLSIHPGLCLPHINVHVCIQIQLSTNMIWFSCDSKHNGSEFMCAVCGYFSLVCGYFSLVWKKITCCKCQVAAMKILSLVCRCQIKQCELCHFTSTVDGQQAFCAYSMSKNKTTSMFVWFKNLQWLFDGLTPYNVTTTWKWSNLVNTPLSRDICWLYDWTSITSVLHLTTELCTVYVCVCMGGCYKKQRVQSPCPQVLGKKWLGHMWRSLSCVRRGLYKWDVSVDFEDLELGHSFSQVLLKVTSNILTAFTTDQILLTFEITIVANTVALSISATSWTPFWHLHLLIKQCAVKSVRSLAEGHIYDTRGCLHSEHAPALSSHPPI